MAMEQIQKYLGREVLVEYATPDPEATTEPGETLPRLARCVARSGVLNGKPLTPPRTMTRTSHRPCHQKQ